MSSAIALLCCHIMAPSTLKDHIPASAIAALIGKAAEILLTHFTTSQVRSSHLRPRF
ncbi:MAG: hypothetical protein QNJ46_18710 [Leptolyngbyaceae cyanobacterium MO_188.B28]|nr:hypothetical protein [Leptolyngbyaceae cyanobacterium MO_188.B28]